MQTAVPPRPRPRAVTLAAMAVLVAAAAPRLWLAWSDHGIFWPDEIYQSLEQAHRLVFGFGAVPWEFAEGGRSWLFPFLIAAFWSALDALGAEGSLALVTGAKVLMALLSVAAIAAAMRLAADLGGAAAGLWAGTLLAAFPAALVYGSRVLGEVASAPLIVLAALAAAGRSRHGAWIAGLLIGLAVFLRYQNGVILLGLGAWLLAARRWRDAGHFIVAAGGVGLLGGMLDWATWGAPFHAFWTNLEYNLRESGRYGVSDAAFYGAVAWSATGPGLGAVVLGWVAGARRTAPLLAVAMLFVCAHSAVGHKEFRFMMPIVPLALALAAVGIAEALRRVRIRPAVSAALALLVGAAMAQHAARLTFDDLGQYRDKPAGRLAPWHAGEGLNRLLALAGAQPDVCGVWLAGIRPAWSGGYTYLHRDVPLLSGSGAPIAAFANYALAPDAPVPWPMADTAQPVRLPPEYRPAATSRGWTLYRRDAPCAAVTADNPFRI